MSSGRPPLGGEGASSTAAAAAAASSHPGQHQHQHQLDMITDSSRLLALYPIGGPHVPSASVAQHLAPLTEAPLDVRALVPTWHDAADFEQQQRVLSSGGGETEQERAWFDRQLDAVRAVCGLTSEGPSPPAPDGATRPSFGQLVTSLLPPRPASPPPAPPVDPTESSVYFTSFLADTLATMAAAPVAPSQPSGRSYAGSPTSSQGSATPTKTAPPSSASTAGRRSSPADHQPVASTSRTASNGAVPYQPSPLGPNSPAPAETNGSGYMHPPSSSPIVSHGRRSRPPTGHAPIGKIKLKRPPPSAVDVAGPSGASGGGSPTKRAKEEPLGEAGKGTPSGLAKGKGRASGGGSAASKVRTRGKTPGDAQKKLVDLVEDLLESVDTLPADGLPSSHPFFSRIGASSAGSGTSLPRLHSDALRKLDALLSSVRAWPTGLGEGEGDRLVSLLRAAVEDADDDDDEAERAAAEQAQTTPKRASPSKKGAAADAMDVDSEGDVLVVSSSYSSPSYGGFDSTPPRPAAKTARRAGKERAPPVPDEGQRETERGLAAGLLWKLMALPGVPKLHFSEELISTLTTGLTTLLKARIYPALQLPIAPPSLPALARSAAFQLSAVARLLDASEADIVLTEDAVIRLVPLAVGPFFAQGSAGDDGGGGKVKGGKGKRRASDAGGKGKEGLKEIRLEALGVLRAIFGRHEGQRSWVIQEVLTSLVKLPDIKNAQKHFKLRDGQAIHIVSALLLQLVQSCAHGVRQQIHGRRLRDESRMIVDGRGGVDDEDGLATVEAEKEEAQIYAASCEAAARIAKSVASFLTVSSASSKATKSSEKEHRAVLDIVLNDLLTVLYWPEWPAASQVLTWFCKHMIASLKDEKVSAEENASKAIALDHLGHIAARMRVSLNKAVARERKPTAAGIGGTLPLADIVRKSDRKAFDRLAKMQVDLLAHLKKAAGSDLFLLSSYEYTACLWGQELSAEVLRLPDEPVLAAGDDVLLSSQSNGGPPADPRPPVAHSLRSSLGSLWAEHESEDIFLDDADDPALFDDISEEINLARPFGRAFDSTLGAILLALESHSVTFRTKALRALGHILTTDSSILNLGNVRRSIENRLNDPSPAVRDVAVELIGQYLVVQSSLVEKYLPRLSERVDDSGLAVRKRVIKLLRTIYGTLSDPSLQAMIAIRLVERADDEDETVKDLAVKTIEELWFSDAAERAHSAELKSASPSTTGSINSALERKTAVIMLVAGHFRERHSALEVFLVQIVGDKQQHSKHAAHVFQYYKDVCEALIDTLIDAHDRPSLDIGACIHALNHFSAAYPDCVSSSKASHLLPYLRHSQVPDEQAISISLLRIFNRSIRKMPKTSLSFAQSLEKKVLPLINGAMGGWMGLQESVACLCVTVDHLTQNHERLVRLLGSCAGKLEQLRRRYQETGKMPDPKVQNQARPLLYIVALLGEHCDFDELRANNEALGLELNTISEEFMSEYIFALVAFFDKAPVAPEFRRAALQSLGFLFRGYPTLMVEPSSLNVMDSVFASTDLPTKAVLLDVIHDFLLTQVERVKREPVADAAKTTVTANGVNMTELIGDTEKFAESGVGSTIVQRYLVQILNAAQHPLTERIAVEIITFTVKQGLAHPIELAPVVIALETSANPALAERAFALHVFLHHKFNSIINTRFVENARACYVYQTRTSEDVVRGHRLEMTVASAEPVAEVLLGRWYGLVSEKRQIRKDYLRHLVRPFDFDTMADPAHLECTPTHVGFCRFLTDNLAAFEYKTQEEVFVVVERLTAIISVSGTHLFDLLSRAKLDFEADESAVEGQMVAVSVAARPKPPTQFSSSLSDLDELGLQSDDTDHGGPTTVAMYDAQTLANLSIVVSLAFLLKAHLKALYQLSEDKCRKYEPAGKKSAIGDKPTARKAGVPLVLDLEPVPFALRPVETLGDVFEQCSAFINIAEEDGTNLEPEDDSA